MAKYYCGPEFLPNFIRKYFSLDGIDNQACRIHDLDFFMQNGFFKSNWDLSCRVSRHWTFYRKFPKAIMFLLLTTLFGWPIYLWLTFKYRRRNK